MKWSNCAKDFTQCLFHRHLTTTLLVARRMNPSTGTCAVLNSSAVQDVLTVLENPELNIIKQCGWGSEDIHLLAGGDWHAANYSKKSCNSLSDLLFTQHRVFTFIDVDKLTKTWTIYPSFAAVNQSFFIVIAHLPFVSHSDQNTDRVKGSCSTHQQMGLVVLL